MERNAAAGKQGGAREQKHRHVCKPASASQLADEPAFLPAWVQLPHEPLPCSPPSASLTPLPPLPPWRPTPRPAALGAGGTTSLEALRRADAAWRLMRTRTEWGPRPEFVHTEAQPLGAPADVDVAVCGGVLGIFLACALQLRGGKEGQTWRKMNYHGASPAWLGRQLCSPGGSAVRRCHGHAPLGSPQLLLC